MEIEKEKREKNIKREDKKSVDGNVTRKPEKLGAYYFGWLLVYVWEEFMWRRKEKKRKDIYIYIYSILNLVLLVFRTVIISDKDQPTRTLAITDVFFLPVALHKMQDYSNNQESRQVYRNICTAWERRKKSKSTTITVSKVTIHLHLPIYHQKCLLYDGKKF